MFLLFLLFLLSKALTSLWTEHGGFQALANYLRKRTTLEIMCTTALAIMAQKPTRVPDDCVAGVCWALRRDAMNLEQRQLALLILAGVCSCGRERALLWLRHLQRLCRDPALLGRLAELLAATADVATAQAACTTLIAWGQTGDAQQQEASRREMLLLGVADTCRQKQRGGESLSTSFRALLKTLRTNALRDSFSLKMGDTELEVGPTDCISDLERRLRGPVLFAGCVPQSGVFVTPSSRQLVSLGVALRCERWPHPWKVCIEGPLTTESACRIDPRLTGERALAFVAAAHLEDGLVREYRLQIKDGPWLDARDRLDEQCTDGCTLELVVPPPSVELEMVGEKRPRKLALMLSHTVREVLQSVGQEQNGLWMRLRGEPVEGGKQWMAEESTLGQLGVDGRHILRCEPRPILVQFEFKGKRFEMEVMERDEVDGKLLRRARKTCGQITNESLRLFGTIRTHQLFGWAPLGRQGAAGELLCLRQPGDPQIYLSSLQAPFIDDDPHLLTDLFYEKSGDSILEAASLNAIVAHMTGGSSSINLIQMILLTYHSFCTPDQLLKLLMQRRGAAPDVVIRLIGVLKQWLDLDFFMPSEIVDNIVAFLERDIAPRADMKAPLQATRNALLRWARGDTRKYKILERPPASMMPSAPKPFRFRDIPPVEIARQITLETFAVYARIEARELFRQPWNKPKTQNLCPNVMSMIASYNLLAQRVASAIVLADTVRRRVKTIVHFLEVAQALRELQNFHSLSALVSGLGNASVIRLKHTFEALPKKWQRVADEFRSLCDMASSFKNLRETVMKGDPPKIPYIGVYLSDLTFIEDGNPDNVQRTREGEQEPTEFIYLSKRLLFHKILSTIQTWQLVPYNLIPQASIQALIERMASVGDKEMYAESLLREPREQS